VIDILETSIGPAVVQHRLALAVDCRDALSDRPTSTSVGVRYRRIPTPSNPDPQWRPLRGSGRAQVTLRHRIPDDPARPLPQLQLVVDDPSRRYVPRRFTVTPWTYAEVKEPAPYVEAQARLVRIWLRPGSVYAFPRTSTVIRGRVTRVGVPVRWARIEGTTPTSVAGWAHADERGEFVLPIVDPGYDPIRDYPRDLVVTLVVVAAADPDPPDRRDRAADLLSEVIPRSSNPPLPAELDNDMLRGAAVPPGYVGNIAIARQVTVPVGAALTLADDVDFEPQP
jgi:hypothetical protein